MTMEFTYIRNVALALVAILSVFSASAFPALVVAISPSWRNRNFSGPSFAPHFGTFVAKIMLRHRGNPR